MPRILHSTCSSIRTACSESVNFNSMTNVVCVAAGECKSMKQGLGHAQSASSAVAVASVPAAREAVWQCPTHKIPTCGAYRQRHGGTV